MFMNSVSLSVGAYSSFREYSFSRNLYMLFRSAIPCFALKMVQVELTVNVQGEKKKRFWIYYRLCLEMAGNVFPIVLYVFVLFY